jgi:anti-sigma B factor antagonist
MGSPGILVKKLPTRLDVLELSAFRREMQFALESDSPHIVLDLSAINYLGSAGIEFLLDCLSIVVRRDGDIKLAALSREAASLLALTRVERFFEIYRTVEEAVHSFDAVGAENDRFAEPWNAFDAAAKDQAATTE